MKLGGKLKGKIRGPSSSENFIYQHRTLLPQRVVIRPISGQRPPFYVNNRGSNGRKPFLDRLLDDLFHSSNNEGIRRKKDCIAHLPGYTADCGGSLFLSRDINVNQNQT